MPSIDLAFLLSPTPLGIVLAATILVVGTFSVVFIYHWREYGMGGRLAKLAPTVYLGVSGLLCAFALISYIALL